MIAQCAQCAQCGSNCDVVGDAPFVVCDCGHGFTAQNGRRGFRAPHCDEVQQIEFTVRPPTPDQWKQVLQLSERGPLDHAAARVLVCVGLAVGSVVIGLALAVFFMAGIQNETTRSLAGLFGLSVAVGDWSGRRGSA